ncbi:hypothetical protein LOAG_04005 [Loa loa]|uniref:Uncharacterized protein n=1 Tax=Loa loa TaxID=7209 RepID=A0A1S0U2U1_LOALO|nr:hypothetical protein LOAG_04005 [Loa loa]EFO24480.2 hypothetical protein LOAG_04005 [Loa loa]
MSPVLCCCRHSLCLLKISLQMWESGPGIREESIPFTSFTAFFIPPPPSKQNIELGFEITGSFAQQVMKDSITMVKALDFMGLRLEFPKC